MSVNPLAIKIRTKKLGLLIRDSRLHAGKNLADCAAILGIPAARFEAYELGEESPSLPEIEILSDYLEVPFDHFSGNVLLSQETTTSEIMDFQQLLRVRQSIIGVMLKKARVDKGLTLETLSELSGLPVDRLESFEIGELPVTLPELEVLGELLDQPVDEFLDKKGPIGSKIAQQKLVDAVLDLPQELQMFVTKPVNQPYLELAQRLSEMSVEKLRAVAEGLLEITL
jgi:transcriptional regulator with XRE-family HTH domain